VNHLLGAYDGGMRGSYHPRVRVWLVAHVRSPHWGADGGEGGVVGGDEAVADVVDGVAVVVVVLDDHGAEGNGWKVVRYWVRETFGLEMSGCPSAHAYPPWVNPLGVETHYLMAALLAY